jgi:tetratricopeptide (TPR) repeat protein
MFFAFVGLSLSVVWTAGLLCQQIPRAAGVVLGLVVLAASAYGAHQRNEVWRDEASLWRDVTIKSPHNGRGLMNYGLTLMGQGNYPGALDYYTRALQYTPNYSILEINLGIVNGAMGREADAELHFQRAMSLAPQDALPYFYYARWLQQKGRTAEALIPVQTALKLNPSQPDAQALERVLQQAGPSVNDSLADAEKALASKPTAEGYLNLSLHYHQAHRFEDCIRAAREALKLTPDCAEAYNDMAAAFEDLRQWDDAIQAASEALRINPGFTLARNNLAYSQAQKARK